MTKKEKLEKEKLIQLLLNWARRATFNGALIALVLVSPALAHEEHHPTKSDEPAVNYTDWKNLKDEGCCNNQDCRPIKDDDVQETPVVKVRIEGKWCPVLKHHFLKKGNAPDWSRNHVCVRNDFNDPEMRGMTNVSDPCARLLCFQPRPQI